MKEFDTLGTLNAKIESCIDICMKKSGFSYNEFAIFYTLYFSKDGKSTQKQIKDEWLIAKQTIFNICKDYRQKGWIEFTKIDENKNDKREKIISLTPFGRENIKPGIENFLKTNQIIFTKFGARKCQRLFTLLNELSQIYKMQIDSIQG